MTRGGRNDKVGLHSKGWSSGFHFSLNTGSGTNLEFALISIQDQSTRLWCYADGDSAAVKFG